MEQYTTDLLIDPEPPRLVLLSGGDGSSLVFNGQVREAFYSLYCNPGNDLRTADIGHFTGNPEQLSEVLSRLISYGSIPVLIAPEQSHTYYMYKAYCRLEQTVNLLSVEDRPDLDEAGEAPEENNWLSHILAYTPNFLFNYSLVGHQSYLSNPEVLNTLYSLSFDLHRLGLIRQSPDRMEPYFRNADFLSLDISSIRAADCAAGRRAGPNGLYAEEACRLVRYAGVSNKLSSAGIFGWDTTGLYSPAAASLIAQLIWHLYDGISSRSSDGVIGSENEYTVYKISPDSINADLVFFKNNRTGKWWMNVPANEKSKEKFRRHQVVPCSYEDYQQALKGEIPEAWWQTYKKLV